MDVDRQISRRVRRAVVGAGLSVAVALVAGVVAGVGPRDRVDVSTRPPSELTLNDVTPRATDGDDTTTSVLDTTTTVGPTTTAAPVVTPPPTTPPATSAPRPTAPPATQPPTTVPPTPPPAAGCDPGSTGGPTGDLAIRFCSHRAAAGLPAMTRSSQLDDEAAAWARHLAATNQPSHNPDVRPITLRICLSCAITGENIAWATPASVDFAWNFWLGSAGHRSNLDRAQAGVFGIGAALAGDGRTMYYVQMFGWY